jgi:trans-aconitate 2-methyltransferase
MQNYKWDAEDYLNFSSEQQKWGRELIAKLNLKEDDEVLDIGCGNGKITAEISLKVEKGHVTGIDNSEPMIQSAKKNFPPSEYQNLSFEVCDAREIYFQEQFNVVFSNAALHWVDDHKKVLNGISKSLKPGGRILLQFGGKGNAAQAFLIINEIIKDEKWGEYFQDLKFPYNFPGENEYSDMISKSGLNVKRVQLIEKDMMHEGETGFAGWVRTTWLPYTSRIPENEREKFITQIVKRYVEKFPKDLNGKIHIKMVRLEVEAVKNN